ncbi:MAG: rRNA maturation RNase YbeY [Acidobacteriota bacterium]
MTTRPRDAARLHITVVAPAAVKAKARGLGPWLAQVAPRSARGEVVIALVGDARMRSLNRSFRGVDRATDVLSFPADSATVAASTPGAASARLAELGDIAIATGVAARQARAAGHSLGTELRVLALHGLLHLLGFDHEHDHGRMARTEVRLRRAGHLREGLIERARPRR